MAQLNLMNAIKGDFTKKKLGGFVESHSISSGFELLDFMGAGRDSETQEINYGIPMGTIITIIGKSGTGKTTLAMQMAWNFIEQFENGNIIHLDFERSTKKNRILTVLQIDQDTFDEKYLHLNDSTLCSEVLYEQVKAISKLKLENRDKLLVDYETPLGETIQILPPTVILVDSVATMFPKNITDEEELGGQMSATATARQNNSVYKRIPGDLLEANIIIINVNHINTKISINPMMKVAADLNFLKQDEAIVGGNSHIYLSDTLIKIQTRGKLDPDKDFGIKGFFAELTYIKSRSSAAGRPFTMVYDQVFGFNNNYTNYNFLKDCKKVSGGGKGMFLEGLPESKFTQKEFEDKLGTDKKLLKQFQSLLEENLSNLVP